MHDRRPRAVVVGRRRRPGSRCRKLTSAALPAGVDAGYTLDPDGTIEIQTLVPGLLRAAARHDAAVAGRRRPARFVKGALRSAWPARDRQHRRRRRLPGAARRHAVVDVAREDAARDRARLPCRRADRLPRAGGRRVGDPRQGRRGRSSSCRRSEPHDVPHACRAGRGGCSPTSTARGAAAEARAEEAAGVVLALGRVAARAVPSQARVRETTKGPLRGPSKFPSVAGGAFVHLADRPGFRACARPRVARRGFDLLALRTRWELQSRQRTRG